MAENPTTPSPPPMADGLLERLLDEAEASADGVSLPEPPTPEPPPKNPLGLLLQDPTILSALPSLLGRLSSSMGSPMGSPAGNLTGSPGGSGDAAAEGSQRVTHPHAMDRHTALLCALKPYLSPRRRETAETVLRLCRVWDALEKSGISLTDILGTVGGVASQEGRDDRVQ